MEGSPIPVLTVPTAPFEDQRPTGGGGLRRPTGLFEGQRNYLPNFIQSVLSSIDLRDRQGCTMVVGSDGRYFSRTATEIVVQMAAANGVSDWDAPCLTVSLRCSLQGSPWPAGTFCEPHPHLATLPPASHYHRTCRLPERGLTVCLKHPPTPTTLKTLRGLTLL